MGMGLWGWSFSFLVTGQACVSESHTLIGFLVRSFQPSGEKREEWPGCPFGCISWVLCREQERVDWVGGGSGLCRFAGEHKGGNGRSIM